MGKGDKQRPSAVDAETVSDRWAKTFGTPAQGGTGTRHEDADINPDAFDSKPEDTDEDRS